MGLLDRAFEIEGFCVVRGPDVLWGGDIRRFRVPAGRFDGIIGGPPCQVFSRLANMVRQNGRKSRFGNLIPEFERCIDEGEPDWFVMEQVPAAPLPTVEGYGVHSFLLNNRQLGEKQNRVRRWSYGRRGDRRILKIDTVVFENNEYEPAATGGVLTVPKIGGSGKVKKTRYNRRDSLPLNNSKLGFHYLCESQGLPPDFDLPGFTLKGKCQAVGNGVPIAMGRAIARAVRRDLEESRGRLNEG